VFSSLILDKSSYEYLRVVVPRGRVESKQRSNDVKAGREIRGSGRGASRHDIDEISCKKKYGTSLV